MKLTVDLVHYYALSHSYNYLNCSTPADACYYTFAGEFLIFRHRSNFSAADFLLDFFKTKEEERRENSFLFEFNFDFHFF